MPTHLELCPSIYEADVSALTGGPVDREKDTGDVFGFLVTNKGTTVFKTVHKPSAEGRLTGAECSNDSNVIHQHPRVESAMAHLGRDPIAPLLLPAAEEAAPTKKAKDTAQKQLKKVYSGKDGDLIMFDHLHYLSLRLLNLKLICLVQFRRSYVELPNQ